MKFLKRIYSRVSFMFWTTYEAYLYTKSLGILRRMIFIHLFEIIWIFFHVDSMRPRIYKLLKRAYYFKTPFGKYLCFSPNSRRYMMSKDYESPIRDVISHYKHQHKGDLTFINIGANIGRWSIFAVLQGYQGIAFEPAKETYKILKINTILSDIEDDIQLYNCALGDKDENLEFAYIDGLDGSSSMQKVSDWAFLEKNKQKYIVEVKKFDSLHLDKKIYDSDILVVIDVEWFEKEVLFGMENLLDENKNIEIVVEIHEKSWHQKAIFEYMDKKGFKYKLLDFYNRHFYK